VIQEIAEEAEMDTSAGPEQVEDELRAAPASAWLSSASEPQAAGARRRKKLVGVALVLIAAIVAVVLIAHGSSGSGSSSSVASTSTRGEVPQQGGQSPSGGQSPVAMAPLTGSHTSGSASVQTTGSGNVDVNVQGLPDPGNGAYRLWVFNSVIDSKPVGALASGSGTIHATLPADASKYRYLDVTRESSPTDDTYSGEVVLRVPLSKVQSP
jgi:Anti-sigma-K factor rskA